MFINVIIIHNKLTIIIVKLKLVVILLYVIICIEICICSIFRTSFSIKSTNFHYFESNMSLYIFRAWIFIWIYIKLNNISLYYILIYLYF